MVPTVKPLPTPGIAATSRSTQSALIEERTAMLEALGDHRQPPMNPTVRLIREAAVAHPHPLRR